MPVWSNYWPYLEVQQNEIINLHLPHIKEKCPDTMLMEDAENDWTLLVKFPTATGQCLRCQAATNRKDVKSL